MKIPMFKAMGNEDQDQFWFATKAIWEAQGITNYQMKKSTLFISLQDRTLTWYIKYYIDNLTSLLADIQTVLNKEFSRPMS